MKATKKATTFPVTLQARKDLFTRGDSFHNQKSRYLLGYTLTPGKKYEILGIRPRSPDYYELVADDGTIHGLAWELFVEPTE